MQKELTLWVEFALVGIPFGTRFETVLRRLRELKSDHHALTADAAQGIDLGLLHNKLPAGPLEIGRECLDVGIFTRHQVVENGHAPEVIRTVLQEIDVGLEAGPWSLAGAGKHRRLEIRLFRDLELIALRKTSDFREVPIQRWRRIRHHLAQDGIDKLGNLRDGGVTDRPGPEPQRG